MPAPRVGGSGPWGVPAPGGPALGGRGACSGGGGIPACTEVDPSPVDRHTVVKT